MNKATLTAAELTTLKQLTRERRAAASDHTKTAASAPTGTEETVTAPQPSKRDAARKRFLSSVNKGWAFLSDETQTWAVAGDCLNPTMPASQVVTSLKGVGKTVHMINPYDSTKRCHKDFNQIGAPIDVFNLCINAFHGLMYAKQAVALGVKKVFIQPGAESGDILEFLAKNNVEVYQGCVMVELGRGGGR